MKTLARIIILSAILLFFINPLFSQDNEKDYFETRHELSFSISNLFQKNEDMQNVYYYPPYISYYAVDLIYSPYVYVPNNLLKNDNSPLYGISYKYNILNNRAALRLQTFFNYNSDNDEKDYSSNSTNSTEYYNYIVNLSLGFEAHKNFKRTQFYYGVDFSFTYSELSNNSTNTSEQRYYTNNQDPDYYTMITVDYINSIEDNMKKYGINPFLGFKFFISPKVSISTETKFIFELYYEKSKQKNSNNYPDNWVVNTTKSNSDGFISKFGPIGNLSVSYYF